MNKLIATFVNFIKSHPKTVFVLLLVGVSIFYDYPEILLKRPQSIHFWRQSDCASLALNYYQQGMNFFEPTTHNLTSDKGTSGYNCTSEVPILYYAVGGLYHLFGYHEYIYRALNTFLFFLGLLYLFRIFLLVTKCPFWSSGLSLLFFTSPVLVYYGNNFLSNTTALSMSCIAWFYFLMYSKKRQSKTYYTSMFFFLLAGAFKITALLSPLSLMIILIIEKTPFLGSSKPTIIADIKWKHILPFAIMIALLGSWVYFAIQYNLSHESKYFSTTIFPLWDMPKEQIIETTNKVLNQWLTQYYHISLLIAFAFLAIFLHFKRKLLTPLWQKLFAFLFIGAGIYIVLQFYTFGDHDYYTINLNIVPILLTVAGATLIYDHYPHFLRSTISKALLLALLLINTWHAKSALADRYSSKWNINQKDEKLRNITPFLRSLGISHNDKVISIPDESHLSLYLMNQKGWTEHIDRRAHVDDPIYYNNNEESIQESIKKGAKYLIVNGLDQLIKKEYILAFSDHLIGTYKLKDTPNPFEHVYIFDLLNKEVNFNLPDREIKWKTHCNIEQLTNDDKKYKSSDISRFFENQNTQSTKTAYSGRHSVCVSKENPFSLKHNLENIQYGESFKVEIMRKKNKNNIGFLVVSGSDFYSKDCTISQTEKEDWEKLTMEVFIDDKHKGKQLSVYVWNPNDEVVYFDDLNITYYNPISPL